MLREKILVAPNQKRGLPKCNGHIAPSLDPQPVAKRPLLTLVAKAALLSLMAFICGFLLFYPLSPSNHIHFRELTGLEGHRGAAFCAFTRACSSEDDALHQGGTQEGAGDAITIPGLQGVRPIVLEPPHEEKLEEDIIHGVEESIAEPVFSSTAPPPTSIPGSTVEEAQIALSTRTCRSPAIDEYTNIDAPCIDQSPTNEWFQTYYRAGGKQGDLLVEECAAHCSRHMPGDIPGPFQQMPCNVFVYCPLEECWEPDALPSTKGDCWLKFSEAPAKPEVNLRGDLVGAVREKHPEAPPRVQWVSGVLLPPGVPLTNGTWSPRVNW
ncbi:hypothetical protein DUNSADRAFT_3971 [Dunaliella salina]|uniref:Uncharacterized protein n=1 Tax=Dunaliella salina TaxID=3046 RepID=A0ABQ7GSX2_DUNSA|nr:hypothetical protein DUNSADRAFT_3971 [Dunaliella salina]|eukprot:KAF5837716.1 hypothetical protein DUNSADRAFT_3971 [Dunaliella salina]